MRYAIVNIETDEAEFIGVTNSVLEAWEQYAVLFCNAESFPAWLNSKDGDRFTELAGSVTCAMATDTTAGCLSSPIILGAW